MKILLPVKQVIDPSVKIRIEKNSAAIVTDNVKMIMNPFDEIAVEAALQLKEAYSEDISSIIAISIGLNSCQEILTQALALGVDSAIHLLTEQCLSSLIIAKILKQVVIEQAIDLVIMGKQAIDDDNNQVGQMLAGLLNWPQATFASKINLQQQTVIVTREVDFGLETLQCQLPAVITTDLRLNEPRYATLPNIMRAKTKPMQIINLSDFFKQSTDSILELLDVFLPSARNAATKVATAAELYDILKNQQQVI